DLDGDLLVDPGVLGQEDGAEAAGAQIGEDLVLTNGLSQEEHQGARSIASGPRRPGTDAGRVGRWRVPTFMDSARERVRGRGLRIVYAEGLEERALRAAALLRDGDLARPIVIGPAAAVAARAAELGVPLDGIDVRDPVSDPRREDFIRAYLELRRHKGVTEEVAGARVALPHYFAALLVHAGEADGFVSGLDSATKPFIPAFEIVRVREGFKRVSSVFIMVWPDRVLFYADCSVNIAPDPAPPPP